MPPKRKHHLLGSAESSDPYDGNTLVQGSKQYLQDLMSSHSEHAESARKKRLSEATFGCSFGKTNEALFATQTANEDVAQQQEQPEQPKQHDHDAITKAAKPVKTLTDTTRLSKCLSQVKQLEATNEELVKQQKQQQQQLEDQKQQVKELKQQQDDAIKKAVGSAFTEDVNKAAKQAVAEQLSKEVEKAVATRLSEEVQKAVQERLSKEVQKAVDHQLPEALNKYIAPKVSKAMQELIDANERNNEKLRSEIEQEKEKTMKAVAIQQKLSTQLIRKIKNLHKSEVTHKSWKVRFFQQSKAVIAEVKKHAYQATVSAQEANRNLRDAKEKAETAFAIVQADVQSHGDRLEQQQDQLKQLNQVPSRAIGPASSSAITPPSQDSMDLGGTAYPSPSSSHFASSTSSTNNVSTHDDKPRPGLMFNPHGNGRRSDPENIAMRNHSRKGMSSEYNNDSDEELPTSNVPSSDYRPFRSSAEQAPMSFGRPSIGNDTDQSYSHRASRNTPFYPFQQHATYLDGAEQSNSRGTAPPSRARYTPAQERMTPPSRNTPEASQARANYTQAAQQQQQQQQQQRTNNGLNGYEQSNFRRAASPSRKRAHADDDDEWEDYHTETPSQEQDVRSSKRARFFDDTQQPNSFLDDTHQSSFSHPGSQLPTRGRGGRGRGRGRGGHMQRDRASLNGTAQPSSSYLASPAHDQGGYTPGPVRRNNTAQPPHSHSTSTAQNQGGHTPRGPARRNVNAQPPSSYSALPAQNQGGYMPRGPARRDNTAQPPSFEAESTSQEDDPYVASQATEDRKRIAQTNERIAARESLRAPQPQRQSQPQQPQHNGRSTMNRNGRARNGDAEDGRNNNLRYAPPPQPQGPRGFDRNTRASSSRLEEPASAGARANIEDEGEEQMARESRQFGETMRRKKTPNMTQPGAQQRGTARTSAPEPQSFRDTRGLSPEPFGEDQNATDLSPEQHGANCAEIVAQAFASRASRSSRDNGPSQKPVKSTGGGLESRITQPSDEDETSGQRSSNGKKGASKFANLPDGGLMSRSTFPKRR